MTTYEKLQLALLAGGLALEVGNFVINVLTFIGK